jgi:hypothetical protein
MGTKFYKASTKSVSNFSTFRPGRVIIISLLLLSFLPGAGQTNLTFTPLTGDFIAPGRGVQHWGTTNWDDVYVPTVPAGNKTPMNFYTRFNWQDIESSTTPGAYSWSVFDAFVHQAMDNGAMFSFGIMAFCNGCGTLGEVPQYLHNMMQAEGGANVDWSDGGFWTPNYNSVSWKTRYVALMRAVANHIATTSYSGHTYTSAFLGYDLRHYGNFGEGWGQTTGTVPAGAQVTDAYMIQMTDSAIAIFPNVQLTIPMNYVAPNNDYDNRDGNSGTQAAYHILTASNNFGRIGWRRDNIGDDGYNAYFTGTTANYNGAPLLPLLMNCWQVATIGGEPANDLNGTSRCGSIQCDLHNENTLFHMSYVGNGNFPIMSNTSSTLVTAIRNGSAEEGYKLVLTGGSMTTTLASGGPFNITLNWQNIGLAPVYEKWNVTYELRKSDGTVVWTGNSAFTPRLFLPGAATPNSDNLTLSTVPAGTYSMYLIIRDPAAYKKPLPLAITGRGTDGSYLLRSNITIGTGPADQPPTANAGADQTIQLPVSNVSLSGSGTDADGTVSSYAWSKLSGPAGGSIASPATSNTGITGLVQGVYKFVLTVTDNQGVTGSDTVQVTVNAAAAPSDLPPVAKAGSDMNITMPTATVNLNGSGSSDPDGTISSYVWTKISGPTQFTIVNSAIATTPVNKLTAGVYSFQLKVTDNGGMSSMDTVNVVVNAAAPVNQPPVAKAGADQTITLPTNSVTVNGSASSDPDGSIATYLWTKISGPAQYSIGNNTAASTIVNNLTAGVYAFQLRVSDNLGALALDTIKVTVNAAPVNQPPVANAGADISVTLPTNIANLNGSGSTDPDGSVTGYAWSQLSGPGTATIASGASASSGISGLIQGVYVFILKVTDNAGATDVDSVKVTVNAAANQPPVANAGSSKSITLPTNSVSLNGSLSSDPDGSIASYAWVQNSGPSTAALTGASTVSANAGSLIAGQYIFQLTVTDNSGASAKATVKITVLAAGLQPPVANAGADQTITLPTNSVTVDGSASSASSGSIVSYAWSEKSGPSTVTLSNTVSNTLNNLRAGVYVFYLTVTDNMAETGKDSVTITVFPAVNKPPVADAGAGVSLTMPNNSTSLDGSKSYDPDGTISSYSWTLVSGPNTPAASGANTATLNLTGLVAGQYTYQLTVTDNSGVSSSAQVKIRVAAAPNVLPVANAGPNQTITAPASTVNLNGSASYDPDGTIKSYSWVTVSGPGSITISNSNSATPSVSGLQAGQYTFALTVTDNSGATATDAVIITVNPKAIIPNQAPVANAGSNVTITVPPNTVTLNGTSSFDPDGTITVYSWTQISGPSTSVITGANTSTATASQLVVGQYVFQLTVTDNNGATNSDRVTVTVNPEVPKVNFPPIADAGASDTINLPASTYTLDASHSMDPDGTIQSYEWKEVSGPNTVNSSSMNSSEVTISDLQVGVYEFQVTVTDNEGASSVAIMKLTVNQGFAFNNPSERFAIYPNPAHSTINSKIVSPVTGSTKIMVYDMNGKLVLTSEVEKSDNSVTKTINISQLAPGMYTIQINIANRKTMVAKFVKD